MTRPANRRRKERALAAERNARQASKANRDGRPTFTDEERAAAEAAFAELLRQQQEGDR